MDPTRTEEGIVGASAESDELTERVGTLINERYRVLRLIGHGSTGAVYACQHVSLDKLVALKVLHREMEQNAGFVERFKLEAQAAARLAHPNSVRVLDFGQDPATGVLFIAMEYIEGRDLLQVLEEDGPFSAERAVDVMSQILDVLGVAHGLGIVHRDLKPENILLRSVEVDGVTREHVTVCDFGIAQFAGRRSGTASDSTGVANNPDGEEGLVAGTPAYMSPEQARAESQDARSDVYSAGVVLYQLLTLQLPFYADDAYALALKHCVEVPPPPSRFGAVSPQLEEICLKALSKSRDARYQSAREMRVALQRALMATPDASPVPIDAASKPRRWGLSRQMAPHATPSDAPAVEMAPAAVARQSVFERMARWPLAVVAVGACVAAAAFLSHNPEGRRVGGLPSSSVLSTSGRGVLRPSRRAPGGERIELEPSQVQVTAPGSSSGRSQHALTDTALTTLAIADRPDRPDPPALLGAGLPSSTGADIPVSAALSGSRLFEADRPQERQNERQNERQPEGAAVPRASSASGQPRVHAGVLVRAEHRSREAADSADGSAADTAGARPAAAAAASAIDAVVTRAAPARDGNRDSTDSRGSDRAGDQVVRQLDNQDGDPRANRNREALPQTQTANQSDVNSNTDASASAPVVRAPQLDDAAKQDAWGSHVEIELLPDEPAELQTLAALVTGDLSASHAGRSKADAADRASSGLVTAVDHDNQDNAPAAVRTRPQAPPPPMASSARVSITNIASHSGVSRSSIRGALNLSAITACYRSAIRAGGISGSHVVGELELSTSQNGGVTEASLNAPELPRPLRRCVEQIVRRGRVREADTGNAQAIITLAFLPR